MTHEFQSSKFLLNDQSTNQFNLLDFNRFQSKSWKETKKKFCFIYFFNGKENKQQ